MVSRTYAFPTLILTAFEMGSGVVIYTGMGWNQLWERSGVYVTYMMSKRYGFFSFLAFKVYSLTFSLMLNNKSLSSISS